MKPLSVSDALRKLARVRESFRGMINLNFEPKAKNCLTCEEQGVCCTDEHFVNVRVTSLEGDAIARAVRDLPEALRQRVFERNGRVARRIQNLRMSGSEDPGYSCPLFEPGLGCLVHSTAKPLPCIAHACYESRDDLPPEELLEKAEREVALLNNRAYGFGWTLREIPFWLAGLHAGTSDSENGKTG